MNECERPEIVEKPESVIGGSNGPYLHSRNAISSPTLGLSSAGPNSSFLLRQIRFVLYFMHMK